MTHNILTPRPLMHLQAAGHLYPKAWKQIDELRSSRGQDLPDWPDWCFAPLAAWYAIVTDEVRMNPPLPPELVADVARLAALGSWRTTQGVYRFDPDLYQALVDTPLEGAVPGVIFNLPEWCVYVETPGLEFGGNRLAGFFAHLEQDVNSGQEELRLLLDLDEKEGPLLLPIPIHLGGSLKDGLRSAERLAAQFMTAKGIQMPEGALVDTASTLEPLLSLLLYLCCDRPDVGDDWPPERPVARKTRKGVRIFAAKQLRSWDVGARIGAALRLHQDREDQGGSGDDEGGADRNRPRPHIRRAHWHTYQIGKGRKISILKWIPPVPVAFDGGQAVITIRPVKP